MIATILIVAFLVALLGNDIFPPYYEATAKIWVQASSQQGMPPIGDLLMPGLGLTTELQTYCEIIQTRTIVAAAIEELRQEGRSEPLPVHRGKSVVWLANRLGRQLTDKTEQGDLTLKEWKKETVKEILEDFLRANPSRDADIITIRVKQRTPERAQELANKIASVFLEFIKEDMSGQMKMTETFTGQQRDLVKKDLEKVEEQFRDFQVSEQTVNLEAEAEMLIQNLGQLDLQKIQLAQRLEGARGRLDSLTEKLSRVSDTVISAETLTDNPNVMQLEQARHNYQIQFAELRDKYPKGDHPNIKRLTARIQETEKEIADEDRKKITSQTTSLNLIHQALERQIIEALAEIRQVERQLQVLNQQIDNYDVLMKRLPDKQLELARLKRTLLLNQEIFSTLETTKQQASIASAAELGSVKILESADIPDKPVSPRTILNLVLSILIGLAFGIGLAFFKDYFDNTYPTLEEAKRQLEYLPAAPSFLGMVPAIEESADYRIPLIAHDARKSGAAEAFRILRTKLQFLNPEVRLKTILITSSTPSEGKSIVASNLAVTLAQSNKKVLLIDADMRKPVQHKTFIPTRLVHLQEQLSSQSAEGSDSAGALADPEPRKEPGLSELLIRINEDEPHEALSSVLKETEIDNLHLISSGTIPPNPAELLNSEIVPKMISLVEQEYDYIVFDSPPVQVVADPIILSTMVDTIIFVFDISKTRKDMILGGIENLVESAPHKIGALCNLTESKHNGYSRYGYYGGYQYGDSYYSDDDDDVDTGKQKGRRRKERKEKKRSVV